MRIPLDVLKEDSLDLWESTPRKVVREEKRYNLHQQIQKEKEVDRLMREVDESTGALKVSRHLTKRVSRKVRSRIQRSVVQLLHTFGCVIDATMEARFSEVTDQFVWQAYDFDPDIGEDAVYQAARNVMIMNTFQMYLGKPVALTPSVFAYSMLYPYTDNYLDAVDVDTDAKHAANERLTLRLSGISVSPKNRHERVIDRLVGMVEREFDRDAFPGVYDSLLAIHNAQRRSVSQFNADAIGTEELLDISIEKGGTSVLADGYLVAGNLLEDDEQFLFRFGVLLQLIDDLQDLREDYAGTQRTLVGMISESAFLDEFTDRLMSFQETSLVPMFDDEMFERRRLSTLIDRSCRLLILEAIALNDSFYTEGYVAAREKSSPVRFEYLRAVQHRLKREFKSCRIKSLVPHGIEREKAPQHIPDLLLIKN